MANTIYASFSDPALAEKAAGALLDHGVKAEDISLIRNHSGETQSGYSSTTDPNATSSNYSGSTYGTTSADSTYVEPATGIGATDVNTENTAYGTTAYRAANEDIDSNARTVDNVDEDKSDSEKAAKQGISTTTGADAGAGAAKGAGWGLGVGVLAALASLMVPGIGLVVGGGALAIALGGAAATTGAGAVAGAVTGYLKDQGMEEHVAAKYEDAVRSGGAFLAVTVPSGNVDEATVQNLLDKYGAANVNRYGSGGYVA